MRSYQKKVEKLKNKKNVNALNKLLKHKDYSIVWEAAEVLGDLNDPRAVEPLMSILNHENDNIRLNVTQSLGKLGDKRATIPLTDLLQDKYELVRYNAAKALGKIGDTRAIQPLINSLKDEISSDRYVTINSLAIMGKAAVDDLNAALENNDALIRSGAAKALGDIQDTSSVEPLATLLDDEEYNVRSEAAFALAKFKDLRSIKILMELPISKGSIIMHGVSHIIGDTAHNMYSVNFDIKEIEQSIVSIGKPAVETVIYYLNVDDRIIRGMASSILGKLKDPRAIKPLMKLFHDQHSASDARSALVEFGKPAAEYLVEGLKDKNPDIRYWSRKTLIEMKWKPSGEEERVYFHIAGGQYGKLISIGKPAVGPIIISVQDSNQDSNVLKNARQALKQIIGEDLGEDPEIWLKWWGRNKERFE